MRKLSLFVGTILLCEAVGLAGSLFTFSAIPTWYVLLQKPSFAPPSWIFGPVWTILYAFLGLSLALVLQNDWKRSATLSAIKVFGLQLVLNFLWSLLFFGLKSPVLGLIDIVLLWLSILWTIVLFFRLSRWSAYLLVPYFLWVSFAAILNIGFVILNT